MKVLFILKRREDFNSEKHNTKGLSTGLFNSALFMSDMLNKNNIKSEIEVVIDNNGIDRVVSIHKPTHVIIEALWVVPSKFTILTQLHPNVKWIIRLHSEIPFIANESIAFDWLGDYSKSKNIIIAVNAIRMYDELKFFLQTKNNWDTEKINEKVIYLPNYYPQDYKTKEYKIDTEYINIGCFGAVRPLKNHMTQAISALMFAEHINKKLRFHINSGRTEMKGESIIVNLRGLFQHLYEKGHRLIENNWMPHEEFLQLCAGMDIGLQVSFSETFNIVGADIISQGVPLISSPELPWVDKNFSADATSSDQIFKALLLTHTLPYENIRLNQHNLTKYTTETQQLWTNYFRKQK